MARKKLVKITLPDGFVRRRDVFPSLTRNTGPKYTHKKKKNSSFQLPSSNQPQTNTPFFAADLMAAVEGLDLAYKLSVAIAGNDNLNTGGCLKTTYNLICGLGFPVEALKFFSAVETAEADSEGAFDGNTSSIEAIVDVNNTILAVALINPVNPQSSWEHQFVLLGTSAGFLQLQAYRIESRGVDERCKVVKDIDRNNFVASMRTFTDENSSPNGRRRAYEDICRLESVIDLFADSDFENRCAVVVRPITDKSLEDIRDKVEEGVDNLKSAGVM